MCSLKFANRTVELALAEKSKSINGSLAGTGTPGISAAA